MNQKLQIKEKDIDHNVYGLRKVSFSEKYGVKRFPYHGRRRYSPFAYRSVDGGIVISNDVFGLTIRQFDRIYKACLVRRHTQEQYITNLRYPDKTSDEYLEFLQDSTYCNTDTMFRTKKYLTERYLYHYLVRTAGTEIDIRKRQQLFITQDLVQNALGKTAGAKLTKISSGSLAEGLDLPGSDIDVMVVIEDVDVIRDVRNIKHPVQRTTLVMETDNDHPGFTRLRLIAGGDGESLFIQSECFESTNNGLYLSVNTFVGNINEPMHNFKLSSHGPCLSDKSQSVDMAFCLRSKSLPYNAIQWASRHRLQWPPNSVIDKIKNYGCLLVAIGPRTLPDCKVLWRLSFSVAEKLLVHSFNLTQLLCYCLLKLTLKHIVKTNKCVGVNTEKQTEGLLCSYFLKTALFWVSEEVDIDTFQLSKLYSCFSQCLSKIIFWIKNCYCPNYFIPEHNMFLGKINPDNNETLINVLFEIKCNGIDGSLSDLFQHKKGHQSLLRKQFAPSFVTLDLLFYRISHVDYAAPSDILQCLELLKFSRNLRKSTSSTLKVDVCKYRHAEISQYAAQLLPTPTVTTERYNIYKHYHRHLQNGIKTDAISGWLLYASFYYVTEQFNVTLMLTDYVLSIFAQEMVQIGFRDYDDKEIEYYRNHVHPILTLSDKMRMAVVRHVKYVTHSALIPKELQLEVKDQPICIPCIVMSYCLIFLCYHHIGDIVKRNQALDVLDLIVDERRRNSMGINTLSNSMTILGVCYDISGDKDTATYCYTKALQCKGNLCFSAYARISKRQDIV